MNEINSLYEEVREGWDEGVRKAQEGGDIAVSHCCTARLTQHCKAIILQLKFKNNEKLNKNKK